MIKALIASVSPDSISDFIRQQNRLFTPYREDLSHLLSENLSFCELTKLGEIEYADTDRLLVFSCQIVETRHATSLHTRTSRKMQFEIAKKALTADFKDGAIFVFYDERGTFRFSFIRRNYGEKEQKYSNWKRYTYYVEPNAQTNRTFSERVGGCKFESLDAIQQAFSVEQLTKDFYKELSNWYFWAIKSVSFPNDVNDDTDNAKFNSENVIRLITRLIFAWFLKQKDLIKPELFDTEALGSILKDFDATSNTQNNYYRAILQNLFFATLNQEIDKRGFAEDKSYTQNRTTYNIKNLYRYEKEFVNGTDQIMELFRKVPFLNGGLFECLDNKNKEGIIYDWDGFSRNPHLQANIPNALFFANELKVDLSSEYNDKKKKTEKVTGIIEILKRYNFTVEENTPVEVEVALDPELLGKVFENLLGAFNPETQETARKQTGSFYTPREIVNYMVDESLIAYLNTCLLSTQVESTEDKLRQLLRYETDHNPFDATETKSLIHFIFNCKILDPATGSGAFPMGILQQMVHILRKLDPENSHWNNVVMMQALKDFEAADELTDTEKQNLLDEIEHSFDDSVNYPDYARKLYLIENCIYGVDIQSIAVQISKLRFFISLVCEQNHSDDATDNFGIRPLPNLETKFVAANTLIGIEKNEEDMRLFKQDKMLKLIKKLKAVRHRQFLVTNAQKKKDLREQDEALRHEIVTEIRKLYVKRADDDIFRLKMQLKQSEKELENLNKQADIIQTSEAQLDIFGGDKKKTVNLTENKRNELKARIRQLNKDITDGSQYVRLESVVQLAEQLTSWNPYDQNASSPFFDPEWMFGVNEGFDVVIGNPPYGIVKTSNTEKVVLSKYQQYYSADFKINLFALFIEKGLIISNSSGINSFIIPDSSLNLPAFKKLREYILNNSGLNSISHFNEAVFESAEVGMSVILQYVKDKKCDSFKFRSFENKLKYVENVIDLNRVICDVDYKFVYNSNNKMTENLLDKIKLVSTKLKNYCDVYDGINPGSQEIKNTLITNTFIDDDSKMIIDGKCFSRYSEINWGGDYIYYNNEFVEKLRKLIVLRGEAFTGRIIKKTNFFIAEKIVTRQTADSIIGTIDTKKYFVKNSVHSTLIKPEFKDKISLELILGIINSKLIDWFYRTESLESGRLFPQVKIDRLINLPIIIPQESNSIFIIENNVKHLISKDFENYEFIKNNKQNIIDELVFKLYGLTYEEVLVVCPNFWLSEAEYAEIKIE